MPIAKTTNGAATDASLARVKKLAIRNDRGTPVKRTHAKNASNRLHSVVGNTLAWIVAVVRIATRPNTTA